MSTGDSLPRSSVLPVRGAQLAVFKPGNESDDLADADVTVADADVEAIDITERIQARKDTAQLTIGNDDGQYTGDITSGDRVEFIADTPANRKRAYSTDAYGSGLFGGYGSLWTGMVRSQTPERAGPQDATLDIESQDWVFAKCGFAQVYDAFEDAPICLPEEDPNAESAIVNTLLRREAPAIDRSLLGRCETVTDEFSNGQNLLDVLGDLAAKADAVLFSRGRSLAFVPLADLAAKTEIGPADATTHNVRINDDDLANVIRVDGGTDFAVDDAQETVSSYQTVTDTNRILHRISTRKSRLARIEVWTRADRSEDADGIVVRLQKDDGGQPIAVDDTQSDITDPTQISAEFLDDDGFTTFRMSKHTLPEPNPWLIVESDGSTGQEIGVDTSSVPAYRAYFPYPISVRVESPASQREYGRREDRIKDDGLQTFRAARDRGDAELRHRDEPRRELSFGARGPDAHTLQAGEVFDAQFPLEGAVGDHIVIQRTISYAGATMTTDVTAQETKSL
ncbi:hypothetical protein [Halomarina oriensis]|uniref:Uncharacterized protein n=1 Tax=Halomarina oriensis TaxID=671145 RepID=A0A6B0GJ60_9EURY|nr:hypothetical protein [Halomarina oriensis]MWG34814.1 hypothetical protein [Halomarina oriensis]